MKNSPFALLLFFLFTFCSTSNKLVDETFKQALIGQSEMTVYSRLGAPSRIEPAPRGGKVLIYEFESKGMFLTPYKSNITYETQMDPSGNRQGWTYTSNVNRATNDPQYTIYQNKVSYFKIYLNKEGNCVRYEQNLPQEQLDIYHERFKHFLSENN